MRSPSWELLPKTELRRAWRIELASIALALALGLVLALLTLVLGPIAIPVVIALLCLPWFIQDLFRLFIWLLVTWPILTLYVRIPLPAGIPDISYDRTLVLLLLVIIILEVFLSKRRLAKVTALDILVVIYVIAQCSSRIFVLWFGGIGKVDPNGLLDIVLIPVALYWLAKNLVISRAQLKWLLCALMLASLLVCPTGLYEQAVGTRVFKASVSLGGSEVQYQWIDAQGRLRAAGALANPAIYGATLGIGSLAGLCCLPLVKRKLAQATLLAIIGILLYGVFASYTRSAWLSVFVVLFVAQFLVDGLWKKTLPIFMLCLLLLATTWTMLPDNSDVMQRALTTKTIDQRLDLNQLAWEKFLEKPFLGWGSGALNTFSSQTIGIISHNIYLSFLVDGGLVLFLSFLAIVAYLLTRAIHSYLITWQSGLERNALVAMAGTVLIYLLSGLALELRFFAYFNALFWISAGVIDRLGQRVDG